MPYSANSYTPNRYVLRFFVKFSNKYDRKTVVNPKTPPSCYAFLIFVL